MMLEIRQIKNNQDESLKIAGIIEEILIHEYEFKPTI